MNVRLLSICPPSALRPHFQEGYLAGTTDVTWDFDDKTDLDFKNRLIAKFSIPSGEEFWSEGFNSIPKPSLYPQSDNVEKLCKGLSESLKTEMQPGDLGEFMKAWTDLEAYILAKARKISRQDISGRNPSLRDSIKIIEGQGLIDKRTANDLNSLRQYRNKVVHTPAEVKPRSTLKAIDAAIQLHEELKSERTGD